MPAISARIIPSFSGKSSRLLSPKVSDISEALRQGRFGWQISTQMSSVKSIKRLPTALKEEQQRIEEQKAETILSTAEPSENDKGPRYRQATNLSDEIEQ